MVTVHCSKLFNTNSLNCHNTHKVKTNAIPMLQIRQKKQTEVNNLQLVMQLVKWEHWELKPGSQLQCNSFKHYTTELFMQTLGKQWSGSTLNL